MMLLVLSTLVYYVGGTVLMDCSERVEGKNSLTGFTNSKTYVYMTKATDASILFVDGDGALNLKLKIDCSKGQIKASRKPKKTWKSLGKADISCNPSDDLLVVLKGQQVFINTEVVPFTMNAKPKLKASHTIVVKGDNTVAKIATGNCVEYPSSVTTCEEASDFYTQHSYIETSGIYKEGYLDGNYPPTCVVGNNKLFGSYQITQRYDIVCSNKAGEYVLSTKTPIQKTEVNDFIAMCDNTTAE